MYIYIYICIYIYMYIYIYILYIFLCFSTNDKCSGIPLNHALILGKVLVLILGLFIKIMSYAADHIFKEMHLTPLSGLTHTYIWMCV